MSRQVSHSRASRQSVERRDRVCGVKFLLPALDVMLQRHGCRSMARRCLSLLDVLGGVVDVRQHRRAEPARLYRLLEGDILLDAPAHPPLEERRAQAI